MDIIVTYDIKRSHTEIKKELKDLGYHDTINGVTIADRKPITQALPNTTFLKYNALSAQVVMAQVVAVIDKHNGGLDRIFCAQLATNFDWSAQ
jgi:hypothetical protein